MMGAIEDGVRLWGDTALHIRYSHVEAIIDTLLLGLGRTQRAGLLTDTLLKR